MAWRFWMRLHGLHWWGLLVNSARITGDPLHSRAACTQPCNINTHSRAHCSPGARLCEQWGHGCVNNGARLCASARLCRGSPVRMCKIQWYSNQNAKISPKENAFVRCRPYSSDLPVLNLAGNYSTQIYGSSAVVHIYWGLKVTDFNPKYAPIFWVMKFWPTLKNLLHSITQIQDIKNRLFHKYAYS